jgi:hypothetical protein
MGRPTTAERATPADATSFTMKAIQWSSPGGAP